MRISNAEKLLLSEASKRLLRRRGAKWVGVLLLLVFVAVVFVDQLGWIDKARVDHSYDKQTVALKRVIDGDTIVVDRPGENRDTTIRMLGIDSPETHGHVMYFGPEATQHLKDLLGNQPLTLQLPDTDPTDKYGRTLAYVFVDGRINVNQKMVDDGYAYAYRPIQHPLFRQFEQSESVARAKPRGIWVGVKDDQQPEWRQRWIKEHK